MVRIVILIGLLIISTWLAAQNQSASANVQENFQDYLVKANNSDLPLESRIENARKAVGYSENSKSDSLKLLSNKLLADLLLEADQYSDFPRVNHKVLRLANDLADTSAITNTLRYMAYYHYINSRVDSSFYYYYQSRPYYNATGQSTEEARVLFFMADLQETQGDHIGSEENAIKAMEIIRDQDTVHENYDLLWDIFNLLGLNAESREDYEKALDYHQQALEYSRKDKDGFNNSMFSLNNIAVAHRNNGDYEKALKFYDDLLSQKGLQEISPTSYALYVSNRAYTRFLSGDYSRDELLSEFWRSKKMSEELESPIGLINVYDNLKEFYLSENNEDSALYYARKSLNYARQESDNGTVLKSLATLSEIEEPEKANRHLRDYIKLNDSLIETERSNRNKFARIQFETDEIIAENEQISRERLIFLLSSIGLLVTLVLLYIIINQRIKNKELRFNQAQQKANEEIYNLMLAQQDKIEEGRAEEKNRISEELHDGVLGRLFGIRLSLDSLNLQKTDEAVKTRSQYIQELQSIEQEIRKISHDLNSDFVSGSNFSDILRSLVKDQCEAYGLTFNLNEDDSIDWDELTNKTKIHIYRMLQESMQNVYKHANANHIKISFQSKNNVILLTVEDNGSGFNVTKARRGIGLKNFDSRAREIGGKVEIFSAQGEGTKIKIYAPTG